MPPDIYFSTPEAMLLSRRKFQPGQIIQASRFFYTVLQYGDPDYHLVTAGDVRLAVNVDRSFTVEIDAFAPAKNGYNPATTEGAPADADITDDVPKINAALRIANGRRVILSPGVYGQASPIILPSGCWLDGQQFGAVIAAKTSYAGAWQMETENFDAAYANAQTDANGDFHALVPKTVRVTGVELNGSHQSYFRSFYRRNAGHGVRLYCLKPEMDIRVFNIPGKGIWSWTRGGNGPTPLRTGRTKQASLRLLVDQTKEEGIIWDGPGDIVADSIYQCNAGARIVGQAAGGEDTGKVSSPTYGATNGGQTDGVIFNTGLECKFLHSWGNRAGAGVVQYGGRLLADILIAENNHFGGIKFEGGTGMISLLKAHKNGGWVIDFIGAPGVYHESANVFHNSGQTGTETNSHVIAAIQIEDNNSTGTLRNGIVHGIQLGANSRHLIVGGCHVSKQGVIPGNGVYIMAGAAYFDLSGIRVHGALGDTGGGVLSAAVHRAGGGMGRIQGQSVGCAVGYRNAGPTTSLFIETVEMMVSANAGQVVFAGTARANPGQMWRIFGREQTTDVSVSGGQDAT